MTCERCWKAAETKPYTDGVFTAHFCDRCAEALGHKEPEPVEDLLARVEAYLAS